MKIILIDFKDKIRYKIINHLNYILNCKNRKSKNLSKKAINS